MASGCPAVARSGGGRPEVDSHWVVAGGGDSCMQGWFGRFAYEEGLGSIRFSFIFFPSEILCEGKENGIRKANKRHGCRAKINSG